MARDPALRKLDLNVIDGLDQIDTTREPARSLAETSCSAYGPGGMSD